MNGRSAVARSPAVAGTFYPLRPSELRAELDRCLPKSPKRKAVAAVVPHAGYPYSGAVAGAVYAALELPTRFIILSPNHTGDGLPYAIMPEGEWLTPLGAARIDEDLSSRFRTCCPLLQSDAAAHHAEHSLEVQLPFLQRLKDGFTFVPLTLAYVPFERCVEVGQALARTIRETPEPVMILASSDMNHYENREITEAKDSAAIRRIEALDPQGLYETVKREKISMCGVIPTTVALVAALELGARKAELVRHATSSDITGDHSSVVGYAGLIIS